MPRRPNDLKLPSTAAPVEPPRTSPLNLALTAQEKQMIRDGAAALGWSMTNFILVACGRFLATDHRFYSGERPMPTFTDQNGCQWTPTSQEEMQLVLAWLHDAEEAERATRDAQIAAEAQTPLAPTEGRWGMRPPVVSVPVAATPVAPVVAATLQRERIMPAPGALAALANQQNVQPPPAFPSAVPSTPAAPPSLPSFDTDPPLLLLPVAKPGTPAGTFLPMPGPATLDDENG